MKRKNSLRMQFSKNLAWINFISLFVLISIIVIHLSIGFRYINSHFSKSVSKQMVQALQSEMDIAYPFLGEPYVLIEKTESIESINLIDYQILKKNDVLYSSKEDVTTSKGNIFYFFENWINPELTTDFKSFKDGELWHVKVSLNSKLIIWVYTIEILVCLGAFTFIALITRYLAWKFSHVLVVPLKELDKKIFELSNGNVDAVLNNPLEFEKPLEEIDKLATNTNSLIKLMKKQIDLLEEKNCLIDQKMAEISIIFNSIDQGIFYFDNSLNIQSTYSQMCIEIFNEKIEGFMFSNLFCKTDEENKFMNELISKIFEADGIEREVFISLLPDEAEIGNKSVILNYKMIRKSEGTEVLMVILTDITEKKYFLRKMEKEQKYLKMIVKSLLHTDDLIQLIDDYKRFAGELKNSEFEIYDEVFIREIHTFKGSFSLFEFDQTVLQLNTLEDNLCLEESGNKTFKISEDELIHILDEDLQVLESYTGRDYLRGYIYENSKLKSLKEQLSYYTDYIQKLSEKFEKQVLPFEIEGDDVIIDSDIYKNLFRSLIHLFRNSVDHGIETLEERISKNKPEYAKIECKIEINLDYFKIIISDDGRGIDLDLIKQKALDLNYYGKETIDVLDDQSVMNLIFQQGISTKTQKTVVSGKGLGLAAIKHEVQNLDGEIQVYSGIDKGTTFVIKIPFKEKSKNIQNLKELMINVSKNAEKQIFRKLFADAQFQKVEVYDSKIALLDLTSVISLGLPLNALVFVSVNKELLEYLARKMVGDMDYNSEILEDALAETSNTIVGNALDFISISDLVISMGAPVVIESSEENIQYTQEQILSIYYDFDNYKLNIHIVPMHEQTQNKEKEGK